MSIITHADVCLCVVSGAYDMVCPCDCPHDRTKTTEITTSKLAAGIARRVSLIPI